MILDAYYDVLRRLLAEDGLEVGFGTNGATPTPGDTALSADAVYVPITSFETPAPSGSDTIRTLRLHFKLPRSQGNGLEICELGIRTEAGRLIARKTRQPISKTPDMEIGDTWELQV